MELVVSPTQLSHSLVGIPLALSKHLSPTWNEWRVIGDSSGYASAAAADGHATGMSVRRASLVAAGLRSATPTQASQSIARVLELVFLNLSPADRDGANIDVDRSLFRSRHAMKLDLVRPFRHAGERFIPVHFAPYFLHSFLVAFFLFISL